jgi:hypothetical protein
VCKDVFGIYYRTKKESESLTWDTLILQTTTKLI